MMVDGRAHQLRFHVLIVTFFTGSDATLSFVIDDQFCVRKIESPGSFTASPPLEIGDCFYKLNGIFLKRNAEFQELELPNRT